MPIVWIQYVVSVVADTVGILGAWELMGHIGGPGRRNGDWGGFRGARDTDSGMLESSGVWEKVSGVWDGSMDISLFHIIFYSSSTIPQPHLSIHFYLSPLIHLLLKCLATFITDL
jgi:hypothetical protein